MSRLKKFLLYTMTFMIIGTTCYKRDLRNFFLCAITIIIICIISISFALYENSGYCGAEGNEHNVRWELDDEGTLTISGKGKMASYVIKTDNWSGYKITHGNPEWNEDRNDKIKRVIIEDGITSIGRSAFARCSHIEEIVIPDSVTDIENGAFCFCSSLMKVNIPESVTTLHCATFSGCVNLTTIVIPDSVQTIETLAFDGCTRLRNVTVPESLTDFGGNPFKDTEFANKKMKKNELLIINNIVIDGSKCTGDIVVPDGVTKIGNSAFDRFVDSNENLISVTLPDSVETIGKYAFAHCPNLERINIPENLETVEDYAFFQCIKLKDKLILPESVEDIGDGVFTCTDLNFVTPIY